MNRPPLPGGPPPGSQMFPPQAVGTYSQPPPGAGIGIFLYTIEYCRDNVSVLNDSYSSGDGIMIYILPSSV